MNPQELEEHRAARKARLEWIRANIKGRGRLTGQCLEFLLVDCLLTDHEAAETLRQALIELSYDPPPVMTRPGKVII